MATTASVFTACFNSPEHSDVLLRVCVNADASSADDSSADGSEPEPEPEPSDESAQSGQTKCGGQLRVWCRSLGPTAALPMDAAPSKPMARSYHCHAIILSMLSAYFKAALSTTWKQPSSSDGSSSSQRPVEIHVDAEELDALHELLQMLYSQALPAVPPTAPRGALFLQCLRLADRIGAVSCVELLLGGLAALPCENIDSSLLSYVFQAPPGVCISRSFTSLLEACTKALVRMFGDVPAVIKDKDLLQRFCSLPYAAVLAWVKADELQVHSENCVVFLVSGWVQANLDSTAAHHEELAHEIRVFHLGPAYQHHILPALSWFKDCSGMAYLPAVLSCIRAGFKMTERAAAEQEKLLKGQVLLPQGWFAKPRTCSSSSKAVSLVVSPTQLKEMSRGRDVRLPLALYVNGFMVTMEAQQATATSSAATPAPSKVLNVYVGVDVPAMGRRGVLLPDKTMVQYGTVSVKVGSSGSEKSKETKLFQDGLFTAATTLWGRSDILNAAAPTLPQLVAAYLEEGQLHIEATFSAVDS